MSPNVTRSIPFLLALLLSFPALAQEFVDLAVTVEITSIPATPRPGDIISWRATVQNNGPATATKVQFSSGFLQKNCSDQNIAALAAGERRTFDCSMAAPRALTAQIYATVFTDQQAETEYSNNRFDHAIELQTPPDLTIDVFPVRVVDAGLPFALTFHYSNFARTPATDVVIEIDVHGTTVRRMPTNCNATGSLVRCHVPELPQGFGPSVVLELVAPDASAQLLPIIASIHGKEDDLFPETNSVAKETRTFRTFFVENTSDTGSGSLRSAMTAANAECGDGWPCKIAFRIPNGGAKWLTIRPETPLPPLHMAITIDGAMQAAYIGDSNPDGPEIEISGTRLTSGHGIESTCPTEIRGLAINGFPGSGIDIHARSRCLGGAPFGPAGYDAPLIEHNHLGTDPTGMTAIPNERGLVISYGSFTVQRNVVSGNRRSGLTVEGRNVMIRANTIGLDRAHTKDLGNGASGVYVGPGSVGTDVIDNYIGFNHHFGVSLDPRAAYSSMRGNSLQANWSLAIDFGLDGPTMEVPDASSSNPVRRPIILRANYNEALDATIVEGTSETTRERHEVWVAVYSNDEPDPSGYGEGQYYLGEVKADSLGRFVFSYPGRAPGKWVAATSTRQNIIGFARTPETQGICGCGYTTQTSEFSRTVAVE